MPMKYVLGIHHATQVPGMLHGMLFLAYLALALHLSDEENWSKKQLGLACLASIMPFGTLIFDRIYLQKQALR